jgi:hypothetical protein
MRESAVYLDWIRKQECAICGDDCSVHAHHLIDTGDRGISLKEWDVTAIPLCAQHHREIHQIGSQSWELRYGITQCEIVVKMIKRAFYDGVLTINKAIDQAA